MRLGVALFGVRVARVRARHRRPSRLRWPCYHAFHQRGLDIGRNWHAAAVNALKTPTLLPLSPFFLRSYGSPRPYGLRPYRAAKAEDAHVSSWGGGGFRRIDGNGNGNGGGGGGGDGFFGDDGPWRALTAAFALVVVGGGVAAYARKGSRASLQASAAIGAVLLAAAALQTGSTRTAGLLLAAAATAVLGTYMGNAFSKSGKTWPHGALAGLSAALVAGYGSALGSAARVTTA